jgi:F-type H+-transporting ATPase subunit b
MRNRLRLLLAAALLVLFGLFGPARIAAAQEGEGGETEEHDISHEAEECIHTLEDGGDPEDCHEAPSPILPETNEIIWGSISFLLLFFALWKFAFPGIKKGMEARSDRIRADLEQAESAKGEAQSVLDDYRAQLADAKNEAARIIEEARQAADSLRRDQEQRLQTELADLRTRAAADVESAKAQAIADLRAEVAEIAIGAAEVVVGRNLDRSTQLQLVEDYINRVGSNR